MSFVARGTPRPKQSVRFSGGRAFSVMTKKPQAMWAAEVGFRALSARLDTKWTPCTGKALKVSLRFRFGASKHTSVGQQHTKRPDSDNLVKLVLDVLESNQIIVNDSQVSQIEVEKVYARKGDEGLTCTISEIGARKQEQDVDEDIGVPEWMRAERV